MKTKTNVESKKPTKRVTVDMLEGRVNLLDMRWYTVKADLGDEMRLRKSLAERVQALEEKSSWRPHMTAITVAALSGAAYQFFGLDKAFGLGIITGLISWFFALIVDDRL